jgi:hypothetical protein
MVHFITIPSIEMIENLEKCSKLKKIVIEPKVSVRTCNALRPFVGKIEIIVAGTEISNLGEKMVLKKMSAVISLIKL